MVPDRFALILAVGSALGPGAVEPPEAATVPIEDRPYAIRAYVAFDPSTRIDARARDRLVGAWLGLARRMIGPSWSIRVADPDGPASALDPASVGPDDLKPLGAGADKVWLIRGRSSGRSIALEGRELDVATGWLGSLQVVDATFLADLPRALFRLSDRMFAPFAEVGEPSADVVPLRVQGAGLPGGQLGRAVAPPGTVFRPLRTFYGPDGAALNIQGIPFSYLIVTAREGASTRSGLVRGVADPLSKRFARKNRLFALGVKPGASPTRFRFVEGKDKQPASGYVLTARAAPDGPPRVVATTDRQGRATIPGGFADGLVIVRLIAGRAEPLREVPIMPGETEEELTLPVDPRPMAVEFEARLDALRDEIIDLVAVRSRLERRMKAREQGDDWAGVESILVEFRKLTPRDVFARRLDRLAQDAQARESRTKSVVLTKTARAQLAETKSLIDRYLDDETYRAYEDAVARAKARDAKAQAQAKAKSKATPLPPPVATPAPAPAAPTAPPAGAVTPF